MGPWVYRVYAGYLRGIQGVPILRLHIKRPWNKACRGWGARGLMAVLGVCV